MCVFSAADFDTHFPNHAKVRGLSREGGNRGGEEGGKKLIELGNKGGFSNPRGKCKLSALSSSINFRRRARLVRALEIPIFLH